ncbi:hypothetical protein [Paenibacillus alvei]|uniref:hypothetical protein n=1 Tax=Paenibacillus alvei TaxID=44250 RepID=UPI0013DD2D11|nr:hypothetical protein [Paenibacillus alvei]NEZ43732.1 hypothetical protein [Paenibacillus alvei]
MTAFMLLKALKKFLQQTVSEYASSQGEGGRFRTPEVFDWYLPFKNGKISEKIDFPYIIPRIDKADQVNKDGELRYTVKVDLSFGVYCEGKDENGLVIPDGSYDLLNLMEHVQIALFRQKIIENKYLIEEPYSWFIPEEQPYPLWVGQATSLWTLPPITPERGVDIIYGI